MTMTHGFWTLPEGMSQTTGTPEDGIVFGIPGAIPISGDFNGDGLSEMGLYLEGQWYLLTWDAVDRTDVVGGLDVSVLQDRVLKPLLGIADPRRDTRIDFVGGIRGLPELERLVDGGQAALAFAMYPVEVEDLIAISDVGRLMPPKSTWFEPKLLSGLLVHVF